MSFIATISAQDALETFRVVFLGKAKVGKSALLIRFFDNYFEEKYKETIEDLFARVYSVGGRVIKLEIMDTAGNMEYPAMRKLCVSLAHAFVFVYCLSDPRSLQSVIEIFNEIKILRPNDYYSAPIILVGTKNDLLQEGDSKKADFLVDWFMKNGATKGNFARVETSAKTGKGISDIFLKIAELSSIDVSKSTVPVVSREHIKPSIAHRKLSLQDSKSGGRHFGDRDGSRFGAFRRKRPVHKTSSRPSSSTGGRKDTSNLDPEDRDTHAAKSSPRQFIRKVFNKFSSGSSRDETDGDNDNFGGNNDSKNFRDSCKLARDSPIKRKHFSARRCKSKNRRTVHGISKAFEDVRECYIS